jgi:hypothetical protein
MPNSQESTVRQLHSVVPVSPGEQRTRTQPTRANALLNTRGQA